ncbi:MAG: DUF4169 family protein [Rhizobiales bacterium]|nr:DUF4169 family protein [Hyphomicrobiales bacterium]
MADVINLKDIRKRRARAEREAVAEANRLKFGRSKSERSLQDAEQGLEARRLDGHKRDD